MKHFFSFLLIINWFFLSLLYAQQPSGDDYSDVVTSKKTVSQVKRKIVKVAVILPLSGEFKAVGNDLKNSLKTIKSLVENPKYDRIFGENYKFSIQTFDDRCDPDKAQNIAKNIVAQDDIIFVIGHYCSVTSLASAPIYSKAGIIQITPFSTQSTLTEKGYETFFRLAGRTDRYGEVAAEWLQQLKQDHKLATIYGDDVYGKSLVDNVILGLNLRDILVKDIKSKKFQYYYRTPINLNFYRDNLTLLADKLEKDNIELVYFGGYYSDLIKLLKIVKQKNLKIKFITGSSAQNYDFWAQSDGLADRVIFTFTKDYTRDISGEERNKALTSKKFHQYKLRHGLEEAIRKYGIQASRSIFESNKIYRDRVLFIKQYYQENQRFPDAYMAYLYATFEIIKNITIQKTFKKQFEALRNNKLNRITFHKLGIDIANYMKDKGYNTSDEQVGFATILGFVNFSLTGEWSNVDYVFYQWVNRKQERNWISVTGEQKYIGQNGDFVRLF